MVARAARRKRGQSWCLGIYAVVIIFDAHVKGVHVEFTLENFHMRHARTHSRPPAGKPIFRETPSRGFFILVRAGKRAQFDKGVWRCQRCAFLQRCTNLQRNTLRKIWKISTKLRLMEWKFSFVKILRKCRTIFGVLRKFWRKILQISREFKVN